MFARKPKQSHDEKWRDVLMGEARGHICWAPWMRRISRAIPSDPRCKLCDGPFGPPGNIMRFLGFGPSQINRRICRHCIQALEKNPGGAEVELSLLFADVRGSTALAEQTSAEEFSQLMAKFYGTAANVVDERNGIVDKFVGDQVVALFIPGFAGADHASDAIAAARELLAKTGHGDGIPWIPVGAGVHTGVAYVGTVGEGDALDFTALGDSVNTAARLASSAGTGEILVSSAAAAASQLETAGLEARTLALRGRAESVEAWVTRVGEPLGQESLAPVS
ncbi:MAG: adenylate/guanylate cyclase domain-containing protein [Gaiellales bacterium]